MAHVGLHAGVDTLRAVLDLDEQPNLDISRVHFDSCALKFWNKLSDGQSVNKSFWTLFHESWARLFVKTGRSLWRCPFQFPVFNLLEIWAEKFEYGESQRRTI